MGVEDVRSLLKRVYGLFPKAGTRLQANKKFYCKLNSSEVLLPTFLSRKVRLILHTNRQDEIEEILVIVCLAGLDDHTGKRSVHLAVNLFGVTSTESVEEITAVEADIDTALDTLNLKLIGNTSVCGNGGDEKLFGSKAEFNVALGLTESSVL